MKKVIVGLLTLMLAFSVGYGKDLYKRYYNELKNLKDPQISTLVLTYLTGAKEDLGLILTSIVWKESMFGKYIINKDDGKYGSYGIAQILLSTSAARHNVKTSKGRKSLQLKLLTDPKFNLQESMTELLYWKKQYQNKSKYWTTHMVASYNNGWKGYTGKGKVYANDAKLRRKVLIDFFKDESNLKHPVFGKYLAVIREDMVRQGLL